MKKIQIVCRNHKLGRMLECELESTGYSVFGAFDDIIPDAVITDDDSYFFSGPVVYLSGHSGHLAGCVSVAGIIDELNGLFDDQDGNSHPGRLVYSLLDHTVSYGEKRVHLTPAESRLMNVLYQRRGNTVTFTEISAGIKDGGADERYVRYYIHSLRKKIAVLTDRPAIKTDRSGGYGLLL